MLRLTGELSVRSARPLDRAPENVAQRLGERALVAADREDKPLGSGYVGRHSQVAACGERRTRLASTAGKM
jgi:hypothetical protein